ncbi:MAG: GNAT family N-acetyltransferase [Candidatus Doudnabacteria bacterium]|nr:GNAT family N-acetyltransferase [Candidatus Doudnabacteria bacterium]
MDKKTMPNLESESGRNITIQEAKPEDAATLVEINKISWLDTYPNQALGITRQDIEARYSNMAERIATMNKTLLGEQNDTKHTWVARNEYGIIGYCIVTKDTNPDVPNQFRALYLLPGVRGTGTGRKLMETGFSWLGNDKDIRLEVTTYNENAINFYKKMGFEDTGEKGEYEVNGKKMPVSFLIKKVKK